MARIVEVGENTEGALKRLEAYVQSGQINLLIGSGASLPAISVAGNIEADINAALEAHDEATARHLSLDFIEKIGAVHKRLINNDGDANVAATLEQYRALLSSIDRILFERKTQLLPRQANLFTTNYDMFIEVAARQVPSLIVNDGFDRTVGAAGGFPFAPERYFDRTYRSGLVYSQQSEMPTINLIKVHGSLSWRRQDNAILYDEKLPSVLSADDRAAPAKIDEFLSDHVLILPNVRKFHATLLERVYYDLLRLFSNALDRENALLISFGFSFADEHILDITRRALRNPTAQLIIVSYSADGAEDYRAKFEHHRNVLILAPAAGQNLDFARFNALMANILPGTAS